MADATVSWVEFNTAAAAANVSWIELNTAATDATVSWIEFNTAAAPQVVDLNYGGGGGAGGKSRQSLVRKSPVGIVFEDDEDSGVIDVISVLWAVGALECH